MTTELLPCPFCNAPAEFVDTDWASHVDCTNRDCGAFVGGRRPAAAQVAAWNRRASPSPAVEGMLGSAPDGPTSEPTPAQREQVSAWLRDGDEILTAQAITRLSLTDLKRLCDAATAGPWESKDHPSAPFDGQFRVLGPYHPGHVAGQSFDDRTWICYLRKYSDAQFIAAARYWLPELTARLSAPPVSGEKVRELVKEWNATERPKGGDPYEFSALLEHIGDRMVEALIALSAEIETVRAALEKFGEHRNNCARGLNGQCSCGLTAALPTEKATPNEGERT